MGNNCPLNKEAEKEKECNFVTKQVTIALDNSNAENIDNVEQDETTALPSRVGYNVLHKIVPLKIRTVLPSSIHMQMEV